MVRMAWPRPAIIGSIKDFPQHTRCDSGLPGPDKGEGAKRLILGPDPTRYRRGRTATA